MAEPTGHIRFPGDILCPRCDTPLQVEVSWTIALTDAGLQVRGDGEQATRDAVNAVADHLVAHHEKPTAREIAPWVHEQVCALLEGQRLQVDTAVRAITAAPGSMPASRAENPPTV